MRKFEVHFRVEDELINFDLIKHVDESDNYPIQHWRHCSRDGDDSYTMAGNIAFYAKNEEEAVTKANDIVDVLEAQGLI